MLLVLGLSYCEMVYYRVIRFAMIIFVISWLILRNLYKLGGGGVYFQLQLRNRLFKKNVFGKVGAIKDNIIAATVSELQTLICLLDKIVTRALF